MFKPIELSQIDLRYEDYRLKSSVQERVLLGSIAERGIEQPLQGIVAASGDLPVLLDGFKRIRCAKKLGIALIPFVSIAQDAASGILALLRSSNAVSLSLLEQARLVDELKKTYRMSIAEIATRLERSKAWVVVRLDVLSKMSPVTREAVFSGKLPAYTYLYTLRQFRRLTHAKQSEEDEFVKAVSGKNLSTRDLDILARGYFQGGVNLRAQLTSGDLGWCLKELKHDNAVLVAGAAQWSEIERSVARDLEIVGRAMARLTMRLESPQIGSSGFFAEAGLLAGGVTRRLPQFEVMVRRFYDRCRKTPGDPGSTCGGREYPGDRRQATTEPQYGACNPEGAS